MINLTAAQLDAWVALALFPLARILGLISTAPLFNNRAVPVRVRVGLGVAIAVAVVPALPPMPPVPAGSGVAMMVLIQQIGIGVALGFTLRVVFSAVDMAGELISIQMGLSFATIYDPVNASQTAVLAELLSLIASLVFLSMNGHLVMIDALIRSFELLPIQPKLMPGKGWLGLVQFGVIIFVAGLMMALPVIAALLVTNIALGILTRAAPQLNLFSIGFPVTMTVGLGALVLVMPRLDTLMQNFYDRAFNVLAAWLRQTGGG